MLDKILAAEMYRKAAAFQEGAKRLYEKEPNKGDMWFFELYHFLTDVMTLNYPSVTGDKENPYK